MDQPQNSLTVFDTRLTRLEANQENMGRSIRDIAEAVDAIAGTQSNFGRTNWGIVLGGLGVLLSVVTAAATLQTSHLESRLSPLSLSQKYTEDRLQQLEQNERDNLKAVTRLQVLAEISAK